MLHRRLSNDVLLYTLSHLDICSLLFLAATSKAPTLIQFHCIYNIITMRAAKDYKLRIKIKNGFEKQTQEQKSEKTGLTTARYFLNLGIERSEIMHYAGQSGHIEIIRMLRSRRVEHRAPDYSYINGVTTITLYAPSYAPDYRASNGAAWKNKPDIIHFLAGLGINISDTIWPAIYSGSLDVIRALGALGIDFSAIPSKRTICYFGFQPLGSSGGSLFNDVLSGREYESITPTVLTARFKIFLAMLQAGSFPKEGTTKFLSWLDNDFEFHIVSGALSPQVYKDFCSQVKAALEKYSIIYKKDCAAAHRIRMFGKRIEPETGTELREITPTKLPGRR